MTTDKVEDDKFLKDFLSDNFDEKEYATSIVQAQNVTNCMKQINEVIGRLDINLKAHVNTHHQDLLSQAVGIEKLESVLDLMLTRTGALVAGLSKIRRRVNEPHANLESRVAQLRRMQTTCQVLRKTVRIVYLTQRLQGQVKDIAKASASINELEYLFDTVSWDGIEILECNRRITQQIREDLESQAWSLVNLPFDTASNQTQFGLGLQVFHNLNKLPKVVHKLIVDWKSEFSEFLNATVDVKAISKPRESSPSRHGFGSGGPGRAVIPSGGQVAAYRAALWTSVDRLLDHIYTMANRLRLLQKILSKKRDPNTQATLLDSLLTDMTSEGDDRAKVLGLDLDIINFLVTNDESLSSDQLSSTLERRCGGENFVRWVSERIRDEFVGNTSLSVDSGSANNNVAMRQQAFENEYPKLIKLAMDLGSRLVELFPTLSCTSILTGEDDFESQVVKNVSLVENDILVTSGPISTLPTSFSLFLLPLETAFLSRSLARMMESVELAFGGSNTSVSTGGSTASSVTSVVPSASQIDALIRGICTELTLGCVEPGLGYKVGRNAVSTSKLLATRVEGMLVVDGDASQVVGPLTQSQILNTKLINCLQTYRTSLKKAISQLRISNQIYTPISNCLVEIDKLIESGLQPLFQSISDSLEAIIITMHKENFSVDAPAANNKRSGASAQCSLYMKELQEFISRVKAQYLAEFNCPEVLAACLRPHVIRCVDIFLVHASLLPHLSETGKMRLAADCAELELALNPLSPKLTDLGVAYRRLRAFRPLLFHSIEHIVENPNVGTDSMPCSLVLHHLFSRAPPDLQSPYASTGWSLARYSQWILDHPAETDRLQFIRGSLDAYAQSVRSKGQKEYADIYPVMTQLLQKGLQLHTGT